jgi:hypothetical protein
VSRHPERRRPVPIGLRLAGIGVGLALALTGCTAAEVETGASPTASSAVTPTATASPSPSVAAEPVLVPDGTAQDNLPVFSAVVAAVWATPQQVIGQAYVDSLVAAGFDKAAMQLTPDQSTVGNAAESIQFSVRWGGECLVGQVGPATGAPVTAVVPVIDEDTCLVGTTRAIDW